MLITFYLVFKKKFKAKLIRNLMLRLQLCMIISVAQIIIFCGDISNDVLKKKGGLDSKRQIRKSTSRHSQNEKWIFFYNSAWNKSLYCTLSKFTSQKDCILSAKKASLMIHKSCCAIFKINAAFDPQSCSLEIYTTLGFMLSKFRSVNSFCYVMKHLSEGRGWWGNRTNHCHCIPNIYVLKVWPCSLLL